MYVLTAAVGSAMTATTVSTAVPIRALPVVTTGAGAAYVRYVFR